MSITQTEIDDKINEYVINTFSPEDDVLLEIKKNARAQGLPLIFISPQQGALLQFLLKSINAKNVLEIGSLAGYSAIFMARALPSDGKLTALEIDSSRSDILKQNVAKAGLQNVIEVHNENAVDFLKSYNSSIKFDFIFIDADKENYPTYFELSAPLLRKGGIIAADNALAFGEIANEVLTSHKEEVLAVRRYNEMISQSKEFTSCLVTVGDGLALSVKL